MISATRGTSSGVMNGLTGLPTSRISAAALPDLPGSRLAQYRGFVVPHTRPVPWPGPISTRWTARIAVYGMLFGPHRVIPPDHDCVVGASDPLVLIEVRHTAIMDL